MPHPAYILLRWIEAFLCYLVQFGTGVLMITLCLLTTDAALAALKADTPRLTDVILIVDWFAAGVIGAVFLAYGMFDRILDRLRYGPGRLVLDLVMVVTMTRGACFAHDLLRGPASPLSGRLDHPFFLIVAIGWLLLFLAAFLYPALAYRRSEPLPGFRAAWRDHIAMRDVNYARIAVLGSLLLGPAAPVLPSLRLLP